MIDLSHDDYYDDDDSDWKYWNPFPENGSGYNRILS